MKAFVNGLDSRAYRMLLACKPDLAIIANPTALHLQAARAAAEANCHLLIEKPLSHTLDGCQFLVDVVRERNLTALVGCQFRFHPLLRRLREGIAAQRIGRIIGARAEWGEYLPGWHPWEDYHKSYSSRAELGGGVILTLIHPIDYMYWLFGDVDKVHALTRSIDYLETPAQEDWADLILKFSSGVVAHVHLDYHQRPPVHSLSVWGESGRAVCDFQAGTLLWIDASGATTTELAPDGFERNTMFVDQLRHFVECIETRTQPLVPLQEGISVLKIALEAKQPGQDRGIECQAGRWIDSISPPRLSF